jgi:hypothetical protein
VKEKLNDIILLLNKEFGLILGISFGLVFFIYIFNPFPIDHLNYDNRKIFITGLGAIVFLFLIIVRIVFPCLRKDIAQIERKTALSDYNRGIVLWVLSSVAFSFYLDFAGLISLSSYILFKIILICLVPPVVSTFYDKIADLRQQNESLLLEKKIFQMQADKFKEDYLNTSIDFFSDNNGDKLKLLIADVVFINSADNYVEIHYMEAEQLKMKLLRNTLKYIEFQVKLFPVFIRCHRTCIVNIDYIEKITGNCNNNLLTIRGYPSQLPVSRQYFIKIKEAL